MWPVTNDGAQLVAVTVRWQAAPAQQQREAPDRRTQAECSGAQASTATVQ